MGHQQKLFLVSSLFIIGMGILLGLQKYNIARARANQHALMIDLMHIASKAQEYYFKPKYLNGGGYSFEGLVNNRDAFTKLSAAPENENGTFQILPTDNDQSLTVWATGKYDTDEDGKNLIVEIKIFPHKTQTTVLTF